MMTTAEEAAAIEAMRSARTYLELSNAWFLHCDNAEGEQRIRLQREYETNLKRVGIALE